MMDWRWHETPPDVAVLQRRVDVLEATVSSLQAQIVALRAQKTEMPRSLQPPPFGQEVTDRTSPVKIPQAPQPQGPEQPLPWYFNPKFRHIKPEIWC